MSPPGAYGPADYDLMFADPVRTGPYLAAVRAVVRPGDVVVEIGTGVGYFAVAAAQAGARHVFAIEREPAIALGPALARENGVADRVTFIHGEAAMVTLPERGTLLLTDLRGMLPLHGDGLSTIIGARERLLTPEARLIPRRDTVHAAPAEAPRTWHNTELALGATANGVARGAVAAHARLGIRRDHVEASSLLSPPRALFAIDYARVTTPHVSGDADFAVARDGIAHGVALWFDADLADGIGFSTAPSDSTTVYGQAFVPFERPLELKAGDGLRFRLRGTHAGGDYEYAWETTHTRTGSRRTTVMRQTSLAAMLVPGGLRAWAAERPSRS